MTGQRWEGEARKILVCVDSYEKGILCGRYFNAYYGMEQFDSLSQFLIKMEAKLEEFQKPQAYTIPRSFSFRHRTDCAAELPQRCQGAKATFELKILFRQHTSWQGTAVWLEKKLERKFRSVLELIMLIDSALMREEGGRSTAEGLN